MACKIWAINRHASCALSERCQYVRRRCAASGVAPASSRDLCTANVQPGVCTCSNLRILNMNMRINHGMHNYKCFSQDTRSNYSRSLGTAPKMTLNLSQAEVPREAPEVASWEAQPLKALLETPMTKAATPQAPRGPATLHRGACEEQRQHTRSQPFVSLWPSQPAHPPCPHLLQQQASAWHP